MVFLRICRRLRVLCLCPHCESISQKKEKRDSCRGRSCSYSGISHVVWLRLFTLCKAINLDEAPPQMLFIGKLKTVTLNGCSLLCEGSRRSLKVPCPSLSSVFNSTSLNCREPEFQHGKSKLARTGSCIARDLATDIDWPVTSGVFHLG